MILSTGIATLADIEAAVEACRRQGNEQITLLKCTSSYPAPAVEANLKTMVNMAETFSVETGLSDHTEGIVVAVAAAALGARIIEKHFILDRKIASPDAAFSMEPAEFKEMVRAVRTVEKALGRVSYQLSQKALRNREFSRSLFVTQDMKQGEVFSEKNVRSIRPGFGLAPKYLPDVLGKKARDDIESGTPLDWGLIG